MSNCNVAEDAHAAPLLVACGITEIPREMRVQEIYAQIRSYIYRTQDWIH